MTSSTQTKSVEGVAYPFQLRGGAFTVLVLRLDDPKDPTLFKLLADKIAQAPNFFRHAPVVIDLQNLAEAPPFNMAELGRRLRQHQLVPIGVQNATEEQNRAAINAGWSIFPEGRQAALKESHTAPRLLRLRCRRPRERRLSLSHRSGRKPSPAMLRTRWLRAPRRGC